MAPLIGMIGAMRNFYRAPKSMRPFLAALGCLCGLFGCATPHGMNLPLDYSTQQAAYRTQQRIEQELTPAQQLQFYRAAAILGFDALKREGLNAANAALTLQNWMEPAQARARSASPYIASEDTCRFLNAFLGGKTPSGVIAQAAEISGKGNADSLETIGEFLQRLQQYDRALPSQVR